MAINNNNNNKIQLLAIATTITSITSLTLSYLYYNKCKQDKIQQNKDNVYETQQSLNEYLLMHYGSHKQLLNNIHIIDQYDNSYVKQSNNLLTYAADYPRQCALIAIDLIKKQQVVLHNNNNNNVSALEIGCAVGRCSFELTQYFNNVVGLDYSQSFIDAANYIKHNNTVDYKIKVEGNIYHNDTVDLNNYSNIHKNNVTFITGDACNLNIEQLLSLNNNEKYNVILGCNLICRLPQPKQFLQTLHKLINVNGYVILFSPYSWLYEFTPVSEWIGGQCNDHDNTELTSHKHLIQLMNQYNFELVDNSNIPFIIRETARKSQLTTAHKTVWKLRQ